MQMGLEIRRYRRSGGSRKGEGSDVGGILSDLEDYSHNLVQKKNITL